MHGNNLPDSELKLIAESGAAVSVTPRVEARMEMGAALAGRLTRGRRTNSAWASTW